MSFNILPRKYWFSFVAVPQLRIEPEDDDEKYSGGGCPHAGSVWKAAG